MAPAKSYIVDEAHEGQRLDVVLAQIWPEHSRSQWPKHLSQVKLNDGPEPKASTILRAGDVLKYQNKTARIKKVTAAQILIIYSDDDVIVINKPAGVIVYPPAGTQHSGTSVAEIFAGKIDDDDSARAGIVHRLDRGTSGVMILARHRRAKRFLISQFKSRAPVKVYIALVEGHVARESARVELPLARTRSEFSRVRVDPDGKMGILQYELTRRFSAHDLLRITMLTGRTHQIRVQLSYLHNPVVGDKFYGASKNDFGLRRPFLHAAVLKIKLPSGGTRTFEAPLPNELECILDELR